MTASDHRSPELPDQPRRTSRVGLAHALVAAALALHLGVALWYADAPIDDTFIHLQFARNLATGNGFNFNAGEPAYATTAPAWSALIALTSLVGVSEYLAAQVLGVVFGLINVLLVFRLVSRLTNSSTAGGVAALLFGVAPWVARWVAAGMELPAALCAILVSWSLLLSDVRADRRFPLSPLAVVVLCLLRPEGAFMAVAVILGLLWGPDRRRAWTRALAGAATVLILLAAWACGAWLYWGRMIPTTMGAKAHRHTAYKVVLYTVRNLGSGNLVPIFLTGLALIMARKPIGPDRKPRWEALPLRALLTTAVVFAALFGAAYLLTKPYPATRYISVLLPGLVCAAGCAFAYLETLWPHRRARLAIALAVLAAGNAAGLHTLGIRPHTAKWAQARSNMLWNAAVYVRDHTAPGDCVAATEIGMLGYYGERRILDLFGLLEQGFVAAHSTPEIQHALLNAERPTVIVTKGDRLRGGLKLGKGAHAVFPLTPELRARIKDVVLFELASGQTWGDVGMFEPMPAATPDDPAPQTPDPKAWMQRYSLYFLEW